VHQASLLDLFYVMSGSCERALQRLHAILELTIIELGCCCRFNLEVASLPEL